MTLRILSISAGLAVNLALALLLLPQLSTPLPAQKGETESVSKATDGLPSAAKDPAARATRAALAWLAAHQSDDGRWDADGFAQNCQHRNGERCGGFGAQPHDVGITGLALLALIGGGNSHRDGREQPSVKKGLEWLVQQQGASGCFGPREQNQRSYDHAIATLCMSEAHRRSKSAKWKASAQKGIEHVMRMQNPYKAWRYGERPGDNDISVTIWMVLALHAGKRAGLKVQENSIQWAYQFVRDMTSPMTGRTGYTKRGERPVRSEHLRLSFPRRESESLTSGAVLIRMIAGEKKEKNSWMDEGMYLITKRLPDWNLELGRLDMYAWYLSTMATYQFGGEAWRLWNRNLRTELLGHQVKQGAQAGSWSPVGPWGTHGGRVYSTALMAMCLEISEELSYVHGGKNMFTR